MLADRTLLGTTLLVTFLSGGALGYLARDARRPAPVRPYAVETVFATQLDALAQRGYDETELGQARTIYTDYLGEYQTWLNAFFDTHTDALDRLDRRCEERLRDLEATHRERTGGSETR